MKKALFLFFYLILFTSFGQITERNFLTKAFSKESVLQSLVAQNKYQPYPKTSKEWGQLIPLEEQKEIIKRAEGVLKKPVPTIDATLLMEFLLL